MSLFPDGDRLDAEVEIAKGELTAQTNWDDTWNATCSKISRFPIYKAPF